MKFSPESLHEPERGENKVWRTEQLHTFYWIYYLRWWFSAEARLRWWICKAAGGEIYLLTGSGFEGSVNFGFWISKFKTHPCIRNEASHNEGSRCCIWCVYTSGPSFFRLLKLLAAKPPKSEWVFGRAAAAGGSSETWSPAEMTK